MSHEPRPTKVPAMYGKLYYVMVQCLDDLARNLLLFKLSESAPFRFGWEPRQLALPGPAGLSLCMLSHRTGVGHSSSRLVSVSGRTPYDHRPNVITDQDRGRSRGNNGDRWYVFHSASAEGWCVFVRNFERGGSKPELRMDAGLRPISIWRGRMPGKSLVGDEGRVRRATPTPPGQRQRLASSSLLIIDVGRGWENAESRPHKRPTVDANKLAEADRTLEVALTR